MLVLLIVARRNFRAPADPPSLLRLVRFVPSYLGRRAGVRPRRVVLQRDRMTPDLTFLGGAADDLRRAGRASTGPTRTSAVLRRLLPGRAARARDRRRWSASSSCCSGRCTAARPAHADDWERARAPGADLRLGHARLLRPARRQELLLLLRRRRDDRVHVPGRVRARRRATRSAPRLDPRSSSTSSWRCAPQRAWTRRSSPCARRTLPLYSPRGFTSFYLGDEADHRLRRRSPSRAGERRACARPCAGWRARTGSR